MTYYNGTEQITKEEFDKSMEEDRQTEISFVKSLGMHVYSHSAFFYKHNMGKPICNNCECWSVYATWLDGCKCMCHNDGSIFASR